MTPRANRPAAFFDLDKTIIARSSALAFGREFLHNGLITPVTALQLGVAQTLYRISGHSSEQMDSTRDHLVSMVAGWEARTVSRIAEETIHRVVSPAIYAEAKELIAHHKALHHDVVIVSASGYDLVAPIARELGVTRIAATQLEVHDGRYTGEVLFYCKGAAKAEAMRELARVHHYDLARRFAYSDSAVDLPMLEAVGTPVAVNPDRALRRIAADRGWDIRVFRNPVPLFPRTRYTPIAIPVVALTVLALTAFAWRRR